jgi:signal transduction histidine kinase
MVSYQSEEAQEYERTLDTEVQEHRRALDLALLLQAGNLLSASLEPQVVIDQLTELLAKAAGADLVSLIAFDGKLARRISVFGPWLKVDLLARFPVGDTVRWRDDSSARRLKETARPFTSALDAVTMSPQSRTCLRQVGVTTCTALPLIQKGEVIGLAYVYTGGDPPGLDGDTVALLQGLANQAATALEQARLHQTLKAHAITLEQQVATQTETLTRRNRELLVLNDILLVVNAAQDLDVMLVAVVERLREFASAEECSVYLPETPDGPLLVVTTLVGETSGLLTPDQITEGGTLWRLLDGIPSVATLSLAELALSGPVVGSPGNAKVIVCPLRSQGRLLGALLLRVLGHWPRGLDEDFWRTLGDQIGLAIHNRRLHQTAERHAAEAQARAQELDAFAYTVSHDLKAPLGNVRGFANVLAEDYAVALDEPGCFYLDRIDANVQMMVQMIDELLLLSRLDRDQRPPEPVDIGEVIADALLQLHYELQARGVRVTVPSELPIVPGQAIWLERVFTNLIGNAIKYLGDDNPDPRVEVGWEEQPGGTLFWVQDNGVGIAAEDAERIFELFTRVQVAPSKGTGLGLAIVQRVVQRAGGRVWVESEPGKGSRFCFFWPGLI